jgi:hypothetical protein
MNEPAVFQVEVFCVVMPYSVVVGYPHFRHPLHYILQMEAAWTSEALVSYHDTKWHHYPEDFNLKHHCHKSLRTLAINNFISEFYELCIYSEWCQLGACNLSP